MTLKKKSKHIKILTEQNECFMIDNILIHFIKKSSYMNLYTSQS